MWRKGLILLLACNDGVLVYAHSIFYLNKGTIDHK
jgi:hypothetical protein